MMEATVGGSLMQQDTGASGHQINPRPLCLLVVFDPTDFLFLFFQKPINLVIKNNVVKIF